MFTIHIDETGAFVIPKIPKKADESSNGKSHVDIIKTFGLDRLVKKHPQLLEKCELLKILLEYEKSV